MKKYLRSLDSLGRVEIPRDILRDNLIEDDCLFYIKPMPEGILLVPAQGNCALCGGSDGLIETPEGFICGKCVKDAMKAADIKL